MGIPQHKGNKLTQEVPLNGVLAEFRTALQAEIKAAESQASADAVSLTNGQLIGKIGHLLQYRFSIDSFLNVPGDMPGDLLILGHPPIKTTIIGVDGLNVTLSVETQLPKFIPNARLRTNLTYLLRKLIARIEASANKPNPAGDRISGNLGVSGDPTPTPLDELNEEQREALASSVGRDTTFIWGPPGTGKTETIGRIGERLCRRGRSVLLVSHTNTAVDGALLKIAKALGTDLKEGQVIRVGTPKDEELKKREDLLLDRLVETRESDLTARKTAIQEEIDRDLREQRTHERTLALCEWVETARTDLQDATKKLKSLQTLETQCNSLHEERTAIQNEIQLLQPLVNAAHLAQLASEKAFRLRDQLNQASQAVRAEEVRLAHLEAELNRVETTVVLAHEIEPLRQRASELPSSARLSATIETLKSKLETAESSLRKSEAKSSDAEWLLTRTLAANALTRMWKGLPKPELQKVHVQNLRDQLQREKATVEQLRHDFQGANDRLREVLALETSLRPHKDIPSVASLASRVKTCREAVRAQCIERDRKRAVERQIQCEITDLDNQVQAFMSKHGTTPEQALSKVKEIEQRLEAARRAFEIAHSSWSTLNLELETNFARWLLAVREWGLTDCESDILEVSLNVLTNAHAEAVEQTRHINTQELRDKIEKMNRQVDSLMHQVAVIDEQLEHLGELLIAEATVVAATLTGAYLRDAIQTRRFDTVILDEASMAPIPALWIAASLASVNVVVVGDFKQLPPIVLSDHQLAQKWLGRDIFEVARMTKDNELVKPTPAHLIPLAQQHRMHPKIRSIPNDLIYDRLLRDADGMGSDEELSDWYRADWGHDSPVLLVDTGSTNAWVTSVAKGARASRLNFLSATVCVDLAEKLFREGFLRSQPIPKRRILIICPYAPHAKLLRLLIEHQGLSGHVEAGTIHSFQGSEAPVVIFDLVNDEPHWKVSLFTPRRDKDNRRLFNVALTRAKRRLIVVGDFEYCEKLSQKAFLGGRLIPYLRKHYPTVNALDVIPPGVAGRAVKAKTQATGGDVEPRFKRMVVTQTDFYRAVCQDIDKAANRVVIYSPFITQERLGYLEPHIKAAVERGVSLYVVTKAHEDRKKDLRQYRFLEQSLVDWSVRLIHKLRMHEKLVFLDDNLLWVGSLNPLSFTDTQEVMERRESKEVVQDYANAIQLQELLRAYDAGEMVCPVGHEIIAAEGPKEPIYWRCVVKGCFHRNVGQPMPKDGLLTCPNPTCGEALEFGNWGDRYAWRCTKNPHHHMRIHRHHLKLPKMLALVPVRLRSALEKQLTGKRRSKTQDYPDQKELF